MGERIRIVMRCVGHTLLWLSGRPAAAAPICPLGGELLYAVGEPLKKKKKKKKKKNLTTVAWVTAEVRFDPQHLTVS